MTRPPMPTDARPLSPSGAVAVWVALQLAAVLSSAAGVRLWPHHPDPPESIALPVLVAVQVATAPFLYPVVLAGLGPVAVNLGLAFCFDQLAGLLSAAPQAAVLRSSLLVGLWVGGLACCGRLARSRAAETVVTLFAALSTVGGVLTFYIRCEAAAVSGSPAPDPCWYGPLLTGVTQASGTTVPLIGWEISAVPVLVTLVALLFRRVASRSGRANRTPSTSLHDHAH